MPELEMALPTTMDLRKLNVSLTKHGAHKIALLLRDHPKDKVIAQVQGSRPGINIDPGQAKKNMSFDSKGKAPALWDKVRDLGHEAIDALVLIAIVFSHHKLMLAMAAGSTGPFRGTVIRGGVIDGKVYTNFAHTLDELGFSPLHTGDEVRYNLKPLFAIEGLSSLALDLLKRKLKVAGWTGANDAIGEMVEHDFHKALAISEGQFRSWLKSGVPRGTLGESKDEEFFTGADEAPTREFKFRAGHSPRKTGTVPLRAPTEDRRAELLHNEVQTALYKTLVTKHGADAVGTEVATGFGTAIDVVVQLDSQCIFYEIKIADTLRACIRQALPQLMEYAYWRCSDALAQQLVIVGTFAITAEVEAYLKYLRQRFGLPVHYRQFKLKR